MKYFPNLQCHLFDAHVLRIHGSKFQREFSSGSRDIPDRNFIGICRATSSMLMCAWYMTRNFSENFRLVLEKFLNQIFSEFVVPPLRCSCAPDTWFEISGRISFWFSRYSLMKCFLNLSCHLFDAHVLLIHDSKFQGKFPSGSRDIP